MIQRSGRVGAFAATFIVWIVVVGVSSYACAVSWRTNAAATDAPESTFRGALKLVSNVSHLANAPLWVVSWRVLNAHRTLTTALAVNGLGYGAWIGLAWVVYGARRRLRFVWIRRAVSPHEHHQPCESTPLALPTRRAFMLDAGAGAVGFAAGGAGVYGALVTPWSIRVRRYALPVRDLPGSLNGLRIAQFTDPHLGPRVPAWHVRRAVEITLGLKPDLIVLTGDYVHNDPHQGEAVADILAPFTGSGGAPIGVVGVLGNHDHYADARRVVEPLRAVGVRMIDNDRVYIDAATRRLTAAPPAQGLCVAGVGDLYEDTVDPKRALRDAPHDMPRIMLSHNPDVAETREIVEGLTNPAMRVDAMFCGHTHGGQVRLPLLGAPLVPSRYGQKYAHGWVRGPACDVIVSAGIGMSLAPVRLGVPPEIVLVTLECAGST